MLAKIKYISLFLFSGIIASCQTTAEESLVLNNEKAEIVGSSVTLDTSVYIYSWQNKYDYKASLINNIDLPKGYKRSTPQETSLASWLQHVQVKCNSAVYL